MNKNFNLTLFEKLPVVGILRGMKPEKILKIAELYLKAGYSTLEITMNTAGASEIITELAQKFPELNLGAGTVCNMADLDKALSAGASFVVTPIVDTTIIKSCVNQNIAVFPGALTPTEIYQAWNAGATAVKLFPASKFGPAYLKEVLAPLNHIKILPTGGISADNVASYLTAGAYGLGVGSGLFVKECIIDENYDKLFQAFMTFKKCVEEFQKS